MRFILIALICSSCAMTPAFNANDRVYPADAREKDKLQRVYQTQVVVQYPFVVSEVGTWGSALSKINDQRMTEIYRAQQSGEILAPYDPTKIRNLVER